MFIPKPRRGQQEVCVITRTVYDANGNVIAQTDPYVEGTSDPITGSVTQYDALGDVLQTQSITGIVIDVTGTDPNLSSVLTSVGSVISCESSTYDNQGREVSSTDQYGHESITTYDQFGRVVDTRTQSVDENGDTVWLVTRTVYNAQGQVTFTTDQYQEGSAQPVDATETIYDSLGRAVQTVRLSGIQVALVDANRSARQSRHPRSRPLLFGLAPKDLIAAPVKAGIHVRLHRSRYP